MRKSGPVDPEVTQSLLGQKCENKAEHTHKRKLSPPIRRADLRQWPHTSCASRAKSPPLLQHACRLKCCRNVVDARALRRCICSVDMKVIHLSRGNLCLQLEMQILPFTETHIVVLSHNVFNLTGGAKIARVALVGQTASLVRVLPPLSPIGSGFFSLALVRVSGVAGALSSVSRQDTSETPGLRSPLRSDSV